MSSDFIETIIDSAFRWTMFFGVSTHLYDRQARKAVFSQRAFVYSAALHIFEVLLCPAAFKVLLDRQDEESRKLFFVHKLVFVVGGINIAVIFVSIGTQWIRRAKAPHLINEILKIWHKDVAHLRSNAGIRRTAGRLCLLKVVSAILVMGNTAVMSVSSVDFSLLSLAACAHSWMLMSIIVAVQYQLCLGLLFAAHLFEILNWNLSRIVEDIAELSVVYSSRRAHQLSRELLTIGQLYRRLQKWVVSYKNLFQFELLLILMAFFMSQVCMLFILVRGSSEIHKRTYSRMHSQLLLGVGLAVFYTFDNLVILYICGRVISSCSEAGQILKDLSAGGLPSKKLERAIETVCFELQREKIRLSICGLADVDGNTGFAMTEAAMMHIILLVQIDYS